MSVSAALTRAALAKTDGHCFYCGVRIAILAKVDWSIDHMTPVCRGGTDAINNLIPACRSCNSSKRGRTVEEYRASLMMHAGRIFTPAQIDFWSSIGVQLPVAEKIRFWNEP